MNKVYVLGGFRTPIVVKNNKFKNTFKRWNNNIRNRRRRKRVRRVKKGTSRSI